MSLTKSGFSVQSTVFNRQFDKRICIASIENLGIPVNFKQCCREIGVVQNGLTCCSNIVFSRDSRNYILCDYP